MERKFLVVESFTVYHEYEVMADCPDDAEEKLTEFIAQELHKEDVEHLSGNDSTDLYRIECGEELEVK